jgi:DNA-binding MarR family transcriptional regulator
VHNVEKILEKELNDIPLGLFISIIHRTHMVHLNHEMKDLNITSAQFPYLMVLSNKEGQTQEDLASYCSIDKGTVARSIKKLEDQELIIRKTDPKNRRRYLLFLTEKGRNIVPQVHEIDAEWENFIFKDYSEEEKKQIADLLQNLAKKSLKKLDYNG